MDTKNSVTMKVLPGRSERREYLGMNLSYFIYGKEKTEKMMMDIYDSESLNSEE